MSNTVAGEFGGTAPFGEAGRPPQRVRDFCDQIASGAPADVLPALMQLAQTMGARDMSIATPIAGALESPAVDLTGGVVGIWERSVAGGETCFVRRSDMKSEWSFWADVARIPPKGSRWRVALIGESVARGYLFDPVHSPARVLQTLLDAALGADAAEVIDLARSNLGYDVRELAIAALQLEPDVVVVFAGNNWRLQHVPTPHDLLGNNPGPPEMSASAARMFAEQAIRRTGQRVVGDVSAACRQRGIPLVWVIPEFNLGDWRDPFSAPPITDHARLREWHDLQQRSHQALIGSRDAEAEMLASRMVDLDEGLSPAGLYVLADARIRAGDIGTAREYLERAKDAAIWETRLHRVPRPYSVMQRMLRQEVSTLMDAVVDVPALLHEHLAGDIPDRRLFVDYCHLTSAGMDVVMRQVAKRVLPFCPDHHSRTEAEAAPTASTMPAAYVEAEASLLAAIYNAHLGQAPGIIRYLAERALTQSAHIAPVMQEIIQGQMRPHAPLLLSTAGARIQALTSPLIHHYLFRGGLQLLDEVLVSSFIEALAHSGIDAEPDIRRLQVEVHSVAHRPVDLLDPYFASSAGHPVLGGDTVFGFDHGLSSYHRAYCPTSSFVFIGTSGVPVRLFLTCRMRSESSEEGVSISVNDQSTAHLLPTPHLSSWDIFVDGDGIRDGINHVRIRWPYPLESELARGRRATQALAENRLPELRLTFGEVHALRAFRADE